MLRVLRCVALVVVIVLAGVGEAYSQATASISGVVKDSASRTPPAESYRAWRSS